MSFQVQSTRKGIIQFKLSSVTKPLDRPKSDRLAVQAMKRILSCDSEHFFFQLGLSIAERSSNFFMRIGSDSLHTFLLDLLFWRSEVAQLNGVSMVRGKLLTSLVSLFGGQLTEGLSC